MESMLYTPEPDPGETKADFLARHPDPDLTDLYEKFGWFEPQEDTTHPPQS